MPLLLLAALMLLLASSLLPSVGAEVCDELQCWKHGRPYYHHEEMDAGY